MKQDYNRKARSLSCVLWTDNEAHMKAFELLKLYKHAYIIHNKDTQEDGTPKKEHIHMVIEFPNPRSRTGVAKEVGIEKEHFEPCTRTLGVLRYLIHADNPEKYQYDKDEVFGDMKPRLVESLEKGSESESERVCKLLDFIESAGRKVTVTELSRYCAENGLWDIFRRSSVIFIKVLEEKNDYLKRVEME